jgi:hypothetical protein
MRDGDVDDVDLLGGEQLAVVDRQASGRVDAFEPGQALWVGVADAGHFGPHGMILERRPARDGGGRLAAHEAAADQPDAEIPGYRTASASSMASA